MPSCFQSANGTLTRPPTHQLRINNAQTNNKQEYCDRGTLRDAVSAGLFHTRLEGGAIGVDLAAVVDVRAFEGGAGF